MLQAIFTLIKYGKKLNQNEFTLRGTAVAHTFCIQNSECELNEEISKIIEFLEKDVLTNLKNVDKRKNREGIMTSLKGLGNIGVISEEFTEQIRDVIQNDDLPVEIRLEAVYVHRKMDCMGSRDYFLDFYRNFTGQTEVRIAAYLQSMRCPDYLSIQQIKYVLETEEVNQVGSFVWSHLTNLAKAASPVRVETQGLLVDGDLGEKYKMDIRKFSRNYEHSLFFDEYNFGANTDSNVIFGTDSYLPRSVSFNLTADLFGESVNFFEFNARMQGFEKLIESTFGQNGPYNTENVKKKFSQVTDFFKEKVDQIEDEINLEKLGLKMKREVSDDDYNFEDEIIEESIRSKRESNSELNKRVDDIGYDLKYKFNEPSASFGWKIFGNDLKYFTVDGFNEAKMAVQLLNPKNYFTQLFSGKEITYTKSGIFLDASYEVPLSSGLPLSITALGASSVDIRMSGSYGGSDFWKTKQLDIEGRIKPSISVDVIATMQTDFFFAKAGIKVKSNLYSSSSIEAKLKVRGNKLVSLQVSLPQDRNDIFNARSELIVMKHAADISQKGISHRYSNSSCTWPIISRAVGLKMCAEFSLPDVSNSTEYPSLVLSGPLELNVHLDKADLTAKIFSFKYRSENNKETGVSEHSFVFDTPGSVIKRIFTANLTTDLSSNNVSMSFDNADIQHSAIGTFKNTEDDRRLELSLNLNGSSNLALEMRLNRTEFKYGWTYYPRLLLSVNNEMIAGMSGNVKVTDKKGISQSDVNLRFETKKLLSTFAGYITKTEASLFTKMNCEYTVSFFFKK